MLNPGTRVSLMILAAAFAIAAPLTAIPAAAQTESILHSFHQDGTDGTDPKGGLVFDAAGNLYGTTSLGGPVKYGIVFELMPTGGGMWTEKTIHNFIHTDGHTPFTGLTFDAFGKLFGTANAGGAFNHGAVFELTPNANGSWGEKVLRNFNQEGNAPHGALVLDPAGNVYGTTYSGGTYGLGSVFELTPKPDGTWTEKVLHSFGSAMDGAYLEAGVILDAAGNIYGTTYGGGAHSEGTVFEITRDGTGWTEQVLYSFNSGTSDGQLPQGGVIFDSAGNLYGTTTQGGMGWGTIFELTPGARGIWTEQILHSFTGTDGAVPFAGLTIDADGNLYGTTVGGGPNFIGTVFELQRAGGGWTETVLHNFSNDGTDGYSPYAGVILDAAGNLYGTTTAGGTYNHGTVFEVTP